MSYSVTRARVFQYIGILLALGMIAVGYWYFSVRASTLNAPQNDSLTSGLVGLWSFNGDDISGTTAYDRSGSGNNGTLAGGPIPVEGKIGQALPFDGTDDSVGVAPSASINNLSAVTAAGWFNQTSCGNGWCTIVGKGYGSSAPSSGWTLMTDITGNSRKTIGFRADFSGTNLLVESSTTFSESAWNYAVVTWDGSTTATNVHIYLNGVEVQYRTQTNATGSYSSDSADVLGIGVISGGGTERLSGKIDEVRVYNRILSATEIQSLYALGQSDKTNSSVSQPQGTGRLDSGLAGYWKLDDGSGTSATDSSTNGNTGTLTNGPTWTTGQIGGAVDFDGSNDYITAGDILDISDNKDFSLAGWFNSDDVLNWGALIAKRNSGDIPGFDVNIINYKINAYLSDTGGSTYNLAGTTTLSASTWYHFVFVFDDESASLTQIYLNGKSENATKTGTLSNINDLSNGYSLTFGRLANNAAIYNGRLDEVRVYNRALSADEVAQLYRLTTPTGVDTGLKGYWSFNGQDVSGTTAFDRSGSGNNGTLTNGPTITEGKLGQGLSFDGTDDYVDAGSASSLDNLTQYTVTAWVKSGTISNNVRRIVSKANTPYVEGWILLACNNGANCTGISYTPCFLVEFSTNLGSWCINNANSLSPNQWHFVAVTYDRSSTSNDPTMYIEGVAAAVTETSAPSGTYVSESGDNLWIGKGTSFFPGSLDEVRVYNRILSATEIQSLYALGQSDKTNTSASQPQGTGRLDSGLAGYWKLDDGSGTSATDSSTNANTGTLTNGPTWTTGQIGGAVDFDGTDDYINIGDNDLYGPADNFTIAAWINQDVITSFQCIFCKDTTYNNAEQFRFSVGDSVNGKLFYATALESVGGNTLLTAGTWYQAVITKSSATGRLTMYLNGVVDGSAAVGTTPSPNSSSAMIGSRANANSTDYWNGKIDEVRFYNRALSADEVAQLYRLTTPTGVDTGLKGYWSFNGKDVSGTTAYDRSGAGNNGTLTNGPTVTEGKLGQALDFDGTNDYVSGPVATTATNNITLSTWFKWGGSTAANQMIIYNGDSALSGYGVYLDPSSSNRLRALAGGVNYIDTASPYIPTVGQWTHITLVRDSSNWQIYIDGVSQGVSSSVSPYSPLGNFLISASNPQTFKGAIDEVRIYNRALSADEVKALYNQSR